MPEALAIIGASYLQVPLIERANELGFETHAFAWSAGDIGERIAKVFHPISIVEKEEILSVCKSLNIVGICTIASDLAAITVGYVAHALGLPGNPPQCIRSTTNKHVMREVFARNNDPSPKSYLVNENTPLDSLDVQYPVIIKPTDRSGSRGITKVESEKGVPGAIEAALEQSFEKEAVLEEFLEGDEYSIESLSYQGQHTLLAITKKHTTGAPHFIEIAHEEPGVLLHGVSRKDVEKVVFHALDSLDVLNGASHSEIMIAEDGSISIVEIGARMGGDCIGSHLVRISTGIDYVGNVIRIAVGKQPDMQEQTTPRAAAVRYVLGGEDMHLLARAEADENVRIEYNTPVMQLDEQKVTDSSTRPGCFVISAKHSEELKPYLESEDY